MTSSATTNASEGFNIKVEEAMMMMSTDHHRHHQNGGAMEAPTSGESALPNEPTSIDSGDSGKNLSSFNFFFYYYYYYENAWEIFNLVEWINI